MSTAQQAEWVSWLVIIIMFAGTFTLGWWARGRRG